MSEPKPTARRVRVERNIYSRTGADGRTAFEVGYRDSHGKQRWKRVHGGITAARAERDAILGAKGKGEVVKPNPKLRFDDAADKWLTEQVSNLRPATQSGYGSAVNVHLRPRWGRRRLDTFTVDDVARLVRELRAEGKSEWTIASVLKAASRIFKFATRRMAWHGVNPVAALDRSERPKAGAAGRRRIYHGPELEQTLEAAHEPYNALFAFAATTGARLSECLGLVWADLDLSDPDAADVRFSYQVDRKGVRQPLKTDESRRTVELPRSLVNVLREHRLWSPQSAGEGFVFCTRSGRPLGQRNVLRELKRAQRAAVDDAGRPTFPVLHERDERGKPVPVPRGSVPNFHAFRHTAASEAIADGDGAEEVAWQLGHKNSNVTRAVYVQEIRDAERVARRRARMEARMGSVLEAASRSRRQDDHPREGGEIVALEPKTATAQ